MGRKKVKHAKAKMQLVAWSLVSAVVLTIFTAFFISDVDPSFFDSGDLGEEILGVQEELYAVERVVDGDTIVVNDSLGESFTVRLIGIDAPETHHPQKPVQCFGEEATVRLTELLDDAQIRLVPDATQADKDKYGRLLRYVYLPDETFVNELLIKEGYAFEYTYDSHPYLFQDDFMQAQQEAFDSKRGLWGPICDAESTN